MIQLKVIKKLEDSLGIVLTHNDNENHLSVKYPYEIESKYKRIIVNEDNCFSTVSDKITCEGSLSIQLFSDYLLIKDNTVDISKKISLDDALNFTKNDLNTFIDKIVKHRSELNDYNLENKRSNRLAYLNLVVTVLKNVKGFDFELLGEESSNSGDAEIWVRYSLGEKVLFA